MWDMSAAPDPDGLLSPPPISGRGAKPVVPVAWTGTTVGGCSRGHQAVGGDTHACMSHYENVIVWPMSLPGGFQAVLIKCVLRAVGVFCRHTHVSAGDAPRGTRLASTAKRQA